MYSIIEESLSDMAFVCGLRTCNQLVNDYREIFHVWRTKTRTRMRKQFIRDRKAALAAGGCRVMACWGRSVLTSVCAIHLVALGQDEPEMPDFDKIINNQPHWSIIRIKRGMAGMKPLIEEAISLHGQLLDMDNVPSAALVNTKSWSSLGVEEVDDDSEATKLVQEAAASRRRREARITALMNGVTEGFVVG